MSSRRSLSAIAVVVVALAGAIYTLAVGNKPLLGLDLQGGVSVVLRPTGEVDEEALARTVEIIRSRVDSLGVAEPEISTQGETIVVDLPGVEQQQRALELVGQTAELRFRPVIADLGPALTSDPEPDPSVVGDGDDADDDSGDGDQMVDSHDGDDTSNDADDEGDDESDAEESSAGVPAGRFSAAAPAQTDTTDDADTADEDADTADDGESDGVDSADDDADTSDDGGAGTGGADDGDDDSAPISPLPQGTLTPDQLTIRDACSIPGVTEPEGDRPELPVVLADEVGNRVCLGPTLLTGEALETAGVSLGNFGEWTVNPVFRSGSEGIGVFNLAARECFQGTEICPPSGIAADQSPRGRLAIVLDHVIVSSPTIGVPTFNRSGIVISGAFEEEGARDLASVLRFGALPIELETQQARTVSASIGDDVLEAGVIAGAIGLALVAAYLLSYYRLAGLVAIGGLVLSALLLWTIIAWFGENLGLALTLAGVVGLIVAVGVSADSNIVYFENVKDAYRGGRKVSTSVERAYQSAISTIVKADVVSLIAAALLYWLTVGAVRGFAFYLGLATILDLVISWLFMRPALAFLARRQMVTKNPSLLGLPPGGPS